MERFLGARKAPTSVLVCPLDGVNGADGGEAAEAVLAALRRCPGLRAQAVQGSPTAGPRPGKGLVALLHHATQFGRLWLTQANADALVWGQRAGSLMRLVVLTRRPPRDLRAGRPSPWSVVALPVDMPDIARHLLHATVLVAAGPVPDSAWRAWSTRLHAALSAAEALVCPPSGALFAGEVPAAHRLALNRLRAYHADRHHDPAGLRAAADAMEDALVTLAPRWPADLVTLARMDWADAHLRAPMTSTRNPRAALRAGLDAYRAGLALLDPEYLPSDTPVVRIRMAAALHRLAWHGDEAGTRTAAVETLETAALTWIRAGAPRRGRALGAAIAAMRLNDAIATSDGSAFAAVVAQVDPLIADASPTDEGPTLARLHHARATALAGLAWLRPAPRLRDQAAASLGEALVLYRRLGMGADLLRARRLLARLRTAAWDCDRTGPLSVAEPVVDTRPKLEPVPMSPVESRSLPRRGDTPASSRPLADAAMPVRAPTPRRMARGRTRRRRSRPRPSDNRA